LAASTGARRRSSQAELLARIGPRDCGYVNTVSVETGISQGDEAGRTSKVPQRSWWQLLRRSWKDAKADQMPLLSAGVAFYAFLAFVPMLIAVVLLYGLVSTPEDVAEQLDSFGSALPTSAEELLREQMESLASAPERSLGIGLVVALAVALWSASNGVGNLLTAINVAYDAKDERGFVKNKLVALGFTIAAIVFLALAVALVAAVPVVLGAIDAPGWVRVIAQAGRWLGLVVAVLVALAVLYRWGPHGDGQVFRWLTVGSVVATALWLVGSLGFSVYVDNFGSYGKTYGSLAGVVVLLLWLWLTAFAVLFGAEINAEADRQTGPSSTG
jgi:membrane protein